MTKEKHKGLKPEAITYLLNKVGSYYMNSSESPFSIRSIIFFASE